MHVFAAFGTRPEAIKLAPVLRECQRGSRFRVTVCNTGQHREILDQMLRFFQIATDYDLGVMVENQSLSHVVARTLEGIDQVLRECVPDLVLVQGDTATTMAAAMAAFFRQVRVGHVEAGLRTYDNSSPFPEEVNRRTVAIVTDIHFAPTAAARDNLLREHVSGDRIHVVGNTVVDALLWTRDRVTAPDADARYRALLAADIGLAVDKARLVTITGHRRESFGSRFEALCSSIATLAAEYPGVQFIYPVHPNPYVRKITTRLLSARPNVHLIRPLSYDRFVWLLNASHFVITDSGGVQEEAPYLGKPVLVTRDHTERREGVVAGGAIMVGTDPERIVSESRRLLDDHEEYHRRQVTSPLYGDGAAARRIVDVLEQFV